MYFSLLDRTPCTDTMEKDCRKKLFIILYIVLFFESKGQKSRIAAFKSHNITSKFIR